MTYLYVITSLQLIALIVSAIKIFGTSYLSAKAKNLADKEDVAKITKEIEEAKSFYKKEHETLKQELALFMNIRSSHRNEERVAIIHFHETYYHWLYTILETPIDRFQSKTINKLTEKEAELDGYFIEINKATSKMSLLVKNPELLRLGNELIIELVNFKSWASLRLIKLEFLLSEDESINIRFTKLLADFEKNRLILQSIADRSTQLNIEKKEAVDDFIKSKVAEFSKCMAISKKFEQEAKLYLTSIS